MKRKGKKKITENYVQVKEETYKDNIRNRQNNRKKYSEIKEELYKNWRALRNPGL